MSEKKSAIYYVGDNGEWYLRGHISRDQAVEILRAELVGSRFYEEIQYGETARHCYMRTIPRYNPYYANENSCYSCSEYESEVRESSKGCGATPVTEVKEILKPSEADDE